ncbi:hypothetical protein AB1Y20_012596 [Prymnesium parvum]|uniref:Prolyl 4-hydroxylase alpha subunit Fe(2+) 2OG dioxygenase domain-containing protein n=1 Tax=Prymnesium parvum TaxID=97485 RepID=A0AB34IIA8_PRYPA
MSRPSRHARSLSDSSAPAPAAPPPPRAPRRTAAPRKRGRPAAAAPPPSHAPPPAAPSSTSGGVALHLSSRSGTGYKKVYYRPKSEPTPYVPEDEYGLPLGRFATAEEAAVCFARYVAGDISVRGQPVRVLQGNGLSGRHARWLLECDGGGEPMWVAPPSVPAPLLEAFLREERVAFNTALVGDLRQSSAACAVDEELAAACAAFLQEHWRDRGLQLGGQYVTGYASYGKTLQPQDAAEQSRHTLLLGPLLIQSAREHLPGFHQMEQQLTAWLENRHNTKFELYFAHGLRQGPSTLRSTSFDVHQDNEDYDFIEHTIVVKLTPDLTGEPPSAMQVVGAEPVSYAPNAGAAIHFRAALHHTSLAPQSDREHLKIAFFFRVRSRDDKRRRAR